jgi:hypothetical protein
VAVNSVFLEVVVGDGQPPVVVAAVMRQFEFHSGENAVTSEA